MTKIEFTVMGEPLIQARPRFFRVGKGIRSYDPNKQDKKDFASVASYNAPNELLECPVIVSVKAYLKRPKSHYRTGKFKNMLKDSAPKHHTGRKDVDNIAKGILDALTGLYWKDDGVVYDLHITKGYSDNPRTEVQINY